MNSKFSTKSRRWVFPWVIVIIIICFVCLYLYLCCWHPATTVLLLRHAEKSSVGGSDPILSPEGEARAQTLVHVGGEADISTIYATEFIRTQQTVQPLANYLGLSVSQYDAGDAAGLVDEIKSNHAGKTIVVVGHSNTLSEIIQEFGGNPIDPIAESEFDNLFIITMFRCRGTKVLHLKYGEES